jgi:hypothetical protein
MRRKFCVPLLLWTVVMGLAPGSLRGQEVPAADPVWPIPLYHDRDDRGPPLAFGTPFVYFHQQKDMPAPPTVETALAQEVPPADPNLPVPLYHDRADAAGVFVAVPGFVFFHEQNGIQVPPTPEPALDLASILDALQDLAEAAVQRLREQGEHVEGPVDYGPEHVIDTP